jgi:hypothetical protein
MDRRWPPARLRAALKTNIGTLKSGFINVLPTIAKLSRSTLPKS